MAVSQQVPQSPQGAVATAAVVVAVVVAAVVAVVVAAVVERMLVVPSAGVGVWSAARARLANEITERAIKLFISTPVVVVPNHSATKSS